MPAGALETDRISKHYGEIAACLEVSFDIRPGEIFGLAGGTGAGKTTVLRIVAGLITADAGEVRLPDGAEIGYLPQRRGLDERMTVLDQLVYLAQLRGMSPNQAHTAAEQYIGRLGLRPVRDTRLSTLDGEDLHLVRFATALVHNPDVLVLDEPFAGLEPSATATLEQLLAERAAAGTTVLLADERLDTAERVCDRVGILHNGHLIACGSIAELRHGASLELIVDAQEATPGWTDLLPGVEVLDVHNGRWRLLVAEDVDDQALLDAARSTGPVHEFQRHEPTLSRLFGHLVSARAEGEPR